MIISNANTYAIESALQAIKNKYNDNPDVRRWDAMSSSGLRHHITLRVKDSRGKGARRSYTGRRIPSACWHVHSDFFDALLRMAPDARIKAGDRTITKDGGNWEDRNIGSTVEPLYFSEACECFNNHYKKQ